MRRWYCDSMRPASSTGEDIVEFQCHGGRAVVDAILSALASIDGLRLAQPGEFTRRAFENGRIDLTEAEGLADLIEAETESQRKAALALAEGGLRKQIAEWQEQLLGLSARAEREIDYDEGDDVDPALRRDCAALAAELEQWLARPRMERLKDGVRVVVAGPPNAGKSSLINAIAGAGPGHRHRHSGDHARLYRGSAGARWHPDTADRHGRVCARAGTSSKRSASSGPIS